MTARLPRAWQAASVAAAAARRVATVRLDTDRYSTDTFCNFLRSRAEPATKFAKGDLLVGEEIGTARPGVWAGCDLAQLPFRASGIHPVREPAVPDMRSRPPHLGVCGVDDDEPPGRREEVLHVRLEHRVLGQVVDHIKGQGQLGGKQTGTVNKTSVVVEKEALCPIVGEPALAQPYRGPGNIHPHVTGVSSQRELMAIATTELDHRAHSVLINECVQERGLSFREGA